MRSTLLTIFCAVLLPGIVLAEAPKKAEPTKILVAPELPPTIADFAYANDSERQKLDLYKAPSTKPTPLVVLIHGGGWKKNDKSMYRADTIQPFLDAGISVARVNYRFIDQATEQKVNPPVKACLLDAARALQTLRYHAKEWNLDPQRVGASGSSAGACTSLWLAMHEDLADPKSSDPVARESTRLTCAAVAGPQTSLDPKELREWMPNAIYGGHAFGFAVEAKDDRAKEFELFLPNRDKLLPLIREYSPIEHASKDDPPLYLDFPNQTTPPVVGQAGPDPTHSAIYGIKLAEKFAPLGVECIVAYPGQPNMKYGSTTIFLIEKLKATQP